MGIKERRARNEDKVSLVRGGRGGGGRGRGGRGGGRGRGDSSGRGRGSSRGRGNGREGQSDRGQEGGRGRGGRGRGRGGRGSSRGRGNFQPKRELDEPEVKEGMFIFTKYCLMRNSGQMIIGKTHPTLYRYFRTRRSSRRKKNATMEIKENG